jgi:hypothetical protein
MKRAGFAPAPERREERFSTSPQGEGKMMRNDSAEVLRAMAYFTRVTLKTLALSLMVRL